MKTSKTSWRPAPVTVVLMTAISVIALLLGVGWLNARRYRVNARVEIAVPSFETVARNKPITEHTKTMPDGEVVHLAARVREASALVVGLSLLAVSEQMQRRPIATVAQLVDRMTAQNLLPPGLTRQGAGVLVSPRATLHLRYRAQPFGLEVVSLSHGRANGPAIIARLAASHDEAGEAVLFIAKRFAGVALPEPFLPAAQINSLGWQSEPLRERADAAQELAQLQNWVQQYGNGLP